MSSPDILIFDEATSALDEANATQIVSMIQNLTTDHGVLLIAHDCYRKHDYRFE
ncbi:MULTISPECIES: hypothetical protein [unclassified Pseudovibrio]|uniref:hypothetical protein n=1 Tax=unclassified Pseudovibrio TaxID=2627060 RepID=UPI00187D58D0|nr:MULTISPECIES: hypothetical protein [unclassified Pseudovibrio]